MPAKPDTQTVAQMAATIASGFASQDDSQLTEEGIAVVSVRIARAIVAQVERAETEDGNAALAAYHHEADHGTDR